MKKSDKGQASLFDWADDQDRQPDQPRSTTPVSSSPQQSGSHKEASHRSKPTIAPDPEGITRRVNQLLDESVPMLRNKSSSSTSDDNDPAWGSLGQLRPTLVRASAGSGKTYQLTARLLRILLQGAPPETVLATTFTRKAAGEILTRVLETLANAADPEQPAALDQLRVQVDLENLGAKTCLTLLDKLMRNIHRLRISTLDSLFSQIARSFPFELGLPPAWRLTDEIEEIWMLERAIDQMVSSLERSETTTLLSMLGKGEVRRSITRELADVVGLAYTVGRQSELAVWKTMKAPKLPDSKAITKTAGELLTAEAKQKTIRAKLQKTGGNLESQAWAAVAEDETLMTNIARSYRTGDPIKFGRSLFPDGLEDAFQVLYQVGRSEVLRLLTAQNSATGQIMQTYANQIETVKQTARAISFDDVTTRLAKHFGQLDPQVLADRLDGSIDHLLLDEFQDTSAAQWQVIRPIAIACASGSDAGQMPGNIGPESAADEVEEVPRSFFCVGDTKQAIYGWRGGVAEIFDAVTDEIEQIEEVPLNKSYRSSEVIMEAVNAVFSRLHRHPMASPKDPSDRSDKRVYQAEAIVRFTKHFPAHQTNRSVPGHVRLMTSRAPDESAESDSAVCFQDTASLAGKIATSAPGKTIGILTRNNQAVGELILLLEQLGLDVSQEGGNPLTDSAAVEIILSALMMADHPGDGRWAFHVSASCLPDGCDFGPDFVRTLAEESGIAQTVQWLADRLAPSCDARDTIRLKQLVRLALQYEINPAPRLRDFVAMVRQKRVERPQRASIRVMTIHQSKGLEFDTVILPQLNEDLVRPQTKPVTMTPTPGGPPTGLSRYLSSKQWHFLSKNWQRAFGQSAAGEVTEALCLNYVAMTRARQSLQMVIAPTRKSEFTSDTMASMIFHAVGCPGDPTSPETVLWELGSPEWMCGE